MISRLLLRNIALYAVIALIFARAVDWDKCFVQRGKYLLGIVYNGHYQNAKDTQVYVDYLKRHHSDNDAFLKRI